MAKSDSKTKPTGRSPEAFVASVENETRRRDAERLLVLFAETTGMVPKMWGPSIIGYGRYQYKYESGREGEFMLTGFSPRRANLAIYVMPGYSAMSDKLDRLGKHKIGKSCLYINKLADVDESVLAEIIHDGLQYMRAKYETRDN